MTSDQWVRVTYPASFRMTIEEFARRASWQLRRRSDGNWVRTTESYQHTGLELFRLRRLAPSSEPAKGWGLLARLPGQDQLQSQAVRNTIASLREVRAPSDPQDPWVAFRLLFMTLPDAQVVPFGRSQFEQLLVTSPDASAWLVEFTDILQGRLAAARALFGARDDRHIEPSLIGPRLFPAGMSFMRSQLLGFPAYLEPALLTLSPWLTGVSSYRVGGSLVFLFGRPLPGLRPDTQAPEMIDLFKPHGFPTAGRSAEPPTVAASEIEAALQWWVSRVSHLFGIALDPANYRSSDGTFDVTGQIGVLMSLERLFMSLQTILVHPRDEFVRSVLLFDVLDLLDGLGFDDWRRMVTLRHTVKAIEELEQTLPPSTKAVLLPRCRAAVESLRDACSHFLPALIDGSQVELTKKDGLHTEKVALDNAYASLLWLTRNASHSYRNHARDPRDVSILSAHDGTVPDQLADLALVHVLRLLSSPKLPTS